MCQRPPRREDGAALVCVVEGHLLRGRRFLRLNVSRLRIGDAEGVGAVVEAHRRVLAARGTLILTGVPETMRVVIGAAGLSVNCCLLAATADEIRTQRPAGGICLTRQVSSRPLKSRSGVGQRGSGRSLRMPR